MFLKDKEKYLSLINQLFKDESDDLLSPEVDSDPDDYLISQKSIQGLLSESEEDETEYIDGGDEEHNMLSQKCNDTLEKIYKSNPDLEQDNTVLWNIVWIQCFCQDIAGCLYYLQQNGIKDNELVQAFSREQDIPFQIIKKTIGSKKIREIRGENTKNRLKKIDSAKPRLKIVRLLLHKLYQGERNEFLYTLYNEDSEDSFPGSLIDNTIKKMDITVDQRIYRLNQWDCEIEHAVRTMTDIVYRLRHDGLIALKSMEFPLSPFYSEATELLLNIRSFEEIEKSLKTLAKKTIQDSKLRMNIVIEGILSIREGEHPFLLLWKIGQKFKTLQNKLNDRLRQPLFEPGIDIEKWDDKGLEKELFETNSPNREILNSIGNEIFWSRPIEDIVIMLLQYSQYARNGGLLAIEDVIPHDLYQSQSLIMTDGPPIRMQYQKTYTFLFYATKMMVEGVKTKHIEFCLRYNASRIIEQTRRHLNLAHHTFSHQASKIGEHPHAIHSIIPEKVLCKD